VPKRVIVPLLVRHSESADGVTVKSRVVLSSTTIFPISLSQFFASKTVIEYVPPESSEKVADDCFVPPLMMYIYGSLPPEAITVIEPFAGSQDAEGLVDSTSTAKDPSHFSLGSPSFEQDITKAIATNSDKDNRGRNFFIRVLSF
jgi:hypothetical protein